jgi:hypothetical protein
MEAGLVRLPGDVRLVGNPAQLAEIIARLNSVDARLAGIERHLGIAAERPAPAEEAGPGNEAPPEDEAPPETG